MPTSFIDPSRRSHADVYDTRRASAADVARLRAIVERSPYSPLPYARSTDAVAALTAESLASGRALILASDGEDVGAGSLSCAALAW